MTKSFNIMDLLLPTNNLGRSVARSNFLRIRRAFAHGAKTLAAIMAKVCVMLGAMLLQARQNSAGRAGTGGFTMGCASRCPVGAWAVHRMSAVLQGCWQRRVEAQRWSLLIQ